MKLPAGPTKFFVAAVLVAGGLFFLWSLLSTGWFIFCLVLAAWEAWTFLDSYPSDTISETIWAYSSRPLIPFVLGAFTCYAFFFVIPLTRDGVVIAGLLGGLMSHFAFQAQSVYEKKDPRRGK